jgi:hypothetical protein
MKDRNMNRKQWKQVWRKCRVRMHSVIGAQLWVQGYAMLQSIHAEIADKLSTQHAAEWRMDRIMPANNDY